MPNNKKTNNKVDNFDEEILVKDSDGKFKTIKVKQSIDRSEAKPPSEPLGAPEPTLATPDVLTKEEKEEIQKTKTPKIKVGGEDFIRSAKDIIQKSGIRLADKILEQRLENIVLMSLKDVRDLFETREVLSRSTETGGLNLDKIEAEKLISIIRGTIIKFRRAGEISSAKKVSPPPPKEKPKLVSSPPPVVPTVVPKPPVVGEPPASKPAPPLPPPPPVPKAQPEKIQLEKPLPKPAPPPSPQMKRPTGPESTKPKVVDIKSPKPVSPAEELKYSLIDFRRLSSDPKERAQKIQEKIKLLEEESFSQKIEGIKSWRISEVNRLYLKIGQESMASGKPITEIIKERESAGQPVLTEAEFKSVGELNRRLRF